jgi:YD repeat-containing protein
MRSHGVVRRSLVLVLTGVVWGGVAVNAETSDPGMEGTPRQPPRPEPVLTMFLEPLSPFTTVRHETPATLQLPRSGVVRLSVASNLTVAEFVWSGAKVVVPGRLSSTAELEARRPGTYTVTVTPRVRLRDGTVELMPKRSRSVTLVVTNVNARRVEVQLKPPESGSVVAHERQEVTFEVETRPTGYEGLVEWTGGGAPATGLGGRFSTSYAVKGRYTVHAGKSQAAGVEVYGLAGVRWGSVAGQTVWYGYPITFEAVTDPAGYEDRVPWRVEAMHDMMTHAEPHTGRGTTFTTQFWPTMDGASFWAQVYAAEVPVLDTPDQLPPVCSPPNCDDGNVCTSDTCAAGVCLHAPYPGVGCPGLPGTGYDEELPAAVEVPCLNAALEPFEGNLAPNPDGCNPVGYACSLPVGLSNGEVKVRVADLEVPSRGFPFVWARSYSSRMNESGPLGFNWELSYHRRILPAGGGTVSVINGVGREDLYPSMGGNAYTSPAGIYDRLVHNGDGTYAQTDPEGMRFDYDAAGYLMAMTDRNGNTLTIVRNGFHNVTQITDTQGRQYSVAYTDGTANQKIASLLDFAGRQVVYTYDGNGDLIRVRGPLVTGMLDSRNNFPGGKTTLYTYSSGFANSKLNHNLLALVEPSYNVGDDPALSKAKVTLTYATTTDPLQEQFDQVVSERWGHDQGGPPGVVVGGTKTFTYTAGPVGDPDAPAGTSLRTMVVDANGNQRAHYFNAARLEIKRIERTNRQVRPNEPDYTTTFTYTSEGLLETRTEPRDNGVSYLYDVANPERRSQKNLLEQRRRANGIAGGGTDLVTEYTYEPVFNQLRTVTEPRGFPNGTVPLDGNGMLNLGNPAVSRYTTTRFFDYQETAGAQAAQGIVPWRRIAEGLGDLNGAADFNEGNVVKVVPPTIQTAGPNFGQAASATFGYNDRGQPLSSTDPEGHVTRRVYNAASGAPNDPNDREGYLQSVTRDFGGLNLVTQFEYDTAGNVTKVTDPKGQDTQYTVNPLNQVVRTRSRVAVGSTRYQVDTIYDANDNVVQTERQNFDENGVLYAHNPLVETAEYDILRNPVSRTRDRSLNDNSQTGTVRTEWLYDANLNLKAARQPLAVSGAVPANLVTLLYDERDLLYKMTTGDNDTNPANAPPLGASVVTTNYDGNRNRIETIDRVRHAQHAFAPTTAFPGSAVGDVTKRGYDGFDRLTLTTDGEGNEHGTAYDLASNAVQTTLRGPVDHAAGTLSLLAQSDRS